MLDYHGLYNTNSWRFIGMGALIGFTLLFSALTVLSLQLLDRESTRR